jgi:hypothetical protein
LAEAEDGEGWEVLDLDCRQGWPLSVQAWMEASFPYGDRAPEPFVPAVRIMVADAYRETLSSDRSHMRDDDGEWIKEPPPWPPILDRDRGMNLPALIDMSQHEPGDVVSFQAFRKEFESG